MPTIGRVLETSLYVDQLDRSVDFYQRIFGFEKVESDDRFCAFKLPGNQILLLFRRGACTEMMPTPGGAIPPHDGAGRVHLAFTMAAADEGAWKERLDEARVPIESRVDWPAGGVSLYFRDPDGHLLELVAPGCWPFY